LTSIYVDAFVLNLKSEDNAAMTTPAATGLRPRQLVIERGSVTIEGRTLERVQLGGWAYGPELGTAPVVVIVGGITASAFPFGDDRTAGDEARAAWWPALGAADLIDPAIYTVLCPSWPGNGSTWKGFDAAAPTDPLSITGLADLVVAWLDGCGCVGPVTWVGASLGGMVGVVFAARHPARCAKLITISAGLRPDGWGTATRHLQRELVRDGLRNGDVATGMSRARQLGMLTYRGRDELDTRFGALRPGLDRPPVAEYLDHHGRRFAERFPVATFLLLSEAIDRGWTADAREVRAAFQNVTAETIVVGVPGDMLFPWPLQVELHRALQAAGADSSLWKLESLYGHDAFLADQEKLADVLRGARAFGGELRVAARPRFAGVGVEPVREIRIGLVGCGTVGTGVLEMIDRQSAAVADRYGVRFRISRIAVRDLSKNRGPRAAGIPITDRALDLVSDPDVDVVVEVAGGMAVEAILTAALAAGKPVVTANKALLASKLAELGVLAQRTETPLYCEAAAAAAIPIVRHLSHRADEIDSLWGIVNATCNFVMTRLEQGDLTLADAISEAQALGFAEADPAADLDGQDAAAKLSILSYRAFGAWVRPDGFLVRGIRDIDPADCDLAGSMGCRIRQIARAVRIDGGLDMAVEPLLLPAWHLLASVEEEYNAVYLRCVSSGDLSLFGKGAGALPTATAILGDLIDLAQDNSVRWPEPRALAVAREGTALAPAPRRHYLRITAQPHPGLERKLEGLVRRHGLTVQNRAAHTAADRVHIGFMISASPESQIAELCAAVDRLARVAGRVCLGVMD
jgi:homoserine dehydrogenase